MNTTKSSEPELILLLGGTFDPIHNGHTQPAKETALWLGATQVSLLPAHIPPHKNSTHATASHRVAMVRLACYEEPLFQLDTRELQRDSHSYTVDTLMELKAAKPNAHLHFIMGMDSLLSFTRWHQWQKILELSNLVINIRPGYCHQQLASKLPPVLLPHIIDNVAQLKLHTHGKIILHDCTAVDISSTQIRHYIHQDINYEALVHPRVFEYIEQQQLYR